MILNMRIYRIKPAMYWLIDVPFRISSALGRVFFKKVFFSKSEKMSDSEALGFAKIVKEICLKEKKFNKFRKNRKYRDVLEHVGYLQGRSYIERIIELDRNYFTINQGRLSNDHFGKPRLFSYPEVKHVSPTTLRYLAVLKEIEAMFEELPFGKFAEIGVGYGGQFQVLTSRLSISEYDMYDLPEVLELTRRYLIETGNESKVNYMDIANLRDKYYDFVISNYAFSELPRVVQIEYLNKIILKSKSGFMIMNSGRTNHTGRSANKVSIEEIIEKIPTAQIFEEIPLTGLDNYILVWGDQISS